MSLNPFHGLSNKREVWAWGMFDLANQSFTLLITTLFFGIFFKEIIVAEPARGEMLWGRSFSIAALIVVIFSPLLGAIADFTSLKKEFLVASGIGCALLTCSLATTGPGTIALAMALYIGANVCFMTGENFLGSLLPEIASREHMGRVSGIGWTMGYVGALLCLPIALLLPGVRDQTIGGFRAVFVFAGVWFLFNSLPTFLFVHERRAYRKLKPGQNLLTVGFKRNIRSAREVGRFRELALFLTCFLVYSCGMQTIIVFAGIIAAEYLGDGVRFGTVDVPGGILLVAFVWILAFVSGVSSFTTLFVQDRVGHKRTLALALGVWILTTIGGALLPDGDKAAWLHIGLVGVGVGIGLGVVGPASRAIVGLLTPPSRTAEFFALWGLAYKLGGVIGPALYGILVLRYGRSTGMIVLAVLFACGLVGIGFVRLQRGIRAAESDELLPGSSSD